METVSEAAEKAATTFDIITGDTAKGRRWVVPHENPRLSETLVQRFDLPEMIARILAARGIKLEEAADFLKPLLKNLMPDPFVLRDMRKGARILADSVKAGRKVGVFGDYDVDGATSTALLVRYFRMVGEGGAELHIPDRLDEGYGPNIDALKGLRDRGCQPVITVDCGITAYTPLEEAAEAGIDILVIDHHAAEPELPHAKAVINPNRLDEDGRLGHLAAVGVAFLTVVAVTNLLREDGYFQERGEPDLMSLLDLVALGTVCDVVPLKDVNRAFVRTGLKVLARRSNPGLRALVDISGVHEAPQAFHLGYILGPRINAAGRIGTADLGARLLSTDDEVEAEEIAATLNALNHERKRIETAALEEAQSLVAATGEDKPSMICIARKTWHPGVIGIVASRLKDQYNCPAIVITTQGGIGKGSGRSVPGVDLGAMIIAARQSGLLINGGGHKMAAGLTVDPEKLDELKAFLQVEIAKQQAEDELTSDLRCDAILNPAGATVELVQDLRLMSPFGAGNSQPRFILEPCRILKASIVGEKHVRCFLGNSMRENAVSAIAFNIVGTELGKFLLSNHSRPCRIAGHLRLNHWQGRTQVQMMIEDAAIMG